MNLARADTSMSRWKMRDQLQSWVSIESENSIKIKSCPIVRVCLEDRTL